MEEKRSILLKSDPVVREVVEPKRQYGGPQSGLPPPFIVGSDVAPYLIVGIDFGSNFCKVSTFADGQIHPLNPREYRALVEDALSIETLEGKLVHSLKHCLAENSVVQTDNQSYSAAEVTSLFLSNLKNEVERVTQRMLAKAVITVPSCFTHIQRSNLMTAAAQAKVQVLSLMNDPAAAALDCCFRNRLSNGKYLVICAGGYTCEFSVVHVQNRLIETKATTGHRSLSGHSITGLLADRLKDRFESCNFDELIIGADRAKLQLSIADDAIVSTAHTSQNLTRQNANELIFGSIMDFRASIRHVLDVAGVQPDELNGVILSGESSKLWFVNETVESLVKKRMIFTGDVSLGAGLYSAILSKQLKDWVVWDSLAAPVMVAEQNNLRDIIACHSPLPISGKLRMVPGENGVISTAIIQRLADSGQDVKNVATCTVNEVLESSRQEASVELTISANTSGMLGFSARHVELDVNLTLSVTEPDTVGPMIDLRTTVATAAAPLYVSNFTAGFTLQQDELGWYVDSVEPNSSAASAGVRVYDRLLSWGIVDSKPVNGRLVLCGESETSVDAVFSRNGHVFESVLEFTTPLMVPKSATEIEKCIVDAVISENDMALYFSLVEYAELLQRQEADSVGEPQNLVQTLSKAASIALILRRPVQRLTALARWSALKLRSHDKKEVEELYEILELYRNQPDDAPLSVTKEILELIRATETLFLSGSNLVVLSALVAEVEQRIDLGGLPPDIRRACSQILALNEQEISVGKPVVLGIDDAFFDDKFDDKREDQLSRTQFESVNFTELLGQLHTESEMPDAVDAASLQYDLRKNFPLSAAASASVLGKWWLENESASAFPSPLDLLICHQLCHAYIKFFSNAENSFAHAADILQECLDESDPARDQSHQAKLFSMLVPILAGAGNLEDAQVYLNRLRQAIRDGARLIHATVTETVDTLIIGGRFDDAISFCEHQIAGLDAGNEKERLELIEAKWNLARLHSYQSDAATILGSYKSLIGLFQTDEYGKLRYVLELYSVLVSRAPELAEPVNQEARELAARLELG